MPAQLYGWTCSACATEWAERATGNYRGADIYANRESVVSDIGYPNNINPSYGLMDGSGAQLQRVLEQWGVRSAQDWLSFDAAYATYGPTIGLMSGGGWYHWVGVRGRTESTLWIANSAPGYAGVWDELSRADFERLGPFSCIWIT